MTLHSLALEPPHPAHRPRLRGHIPSPWDEVEDTAVNLAAPFLRVESTFDPENAVDPTARALDHATAADHATAVDHTSFLVVIEADPAGDGEVDDRRPLDSAHSPWADADELARLGIAS